MNTMNTMKLLFITALIFGAFGCEKPKSSSESTPKISNLTFDPSTLAKGSGTVQVKAQFDFEDDDGDIKTLTYTFEGATETTKVLNVASKTQGAIKVTFSINTAIAKPYSLSGYVTDSKGNKSNTLSGTLTVE